MEIQATSSGGPSFYLVPDNDNAKKVIYEPRNFAFIKYRDGQPTIYIDFTGAPPGAKITLGRAGCNITLPDQHGAGIARQHCYFKCHPVTGAAVLHDSSHNKSTQIYANDDDVVVPISHEMNSVAVTRRFNRSIAIGSRNYYKFRLLWDDDAPIENFLARPATTFGPEKQPFDSAGARYIQGMFLGAGGFGIVHKCADIHTGEAIAVKRFHSLAGKRHAMAIREVNIMLKLSSNNAKQHDHILPILGVEIDKDNYRWIEIIMPLREGNVTTLIESPDRIMKDSEIAEDVLYQMAKALKFMARQKMVHRDIKPENILYDTRMQADGTSAYYHFQLADFNLSNEAATARTHAGTPIFMAPEVYDRELQSCSVDIWSLFVTIVWIYNIDHFRSYSADDKFELRNKITDMAQLDLFVNIRGMAVQNPELRMSARDLVSVLEGTSTRTPQSMSEYTVTGRTVTDADSGSNFVPYISLEAQRGFYATHNMAGQHAIAGPSMDGRSALAADFGYVAAPIPSAAYLNGRIDEAYGYQSPRNEHVVADGNAAFVAGRGGNVGGTVQEQQEDGEGKGKQAEDQEEEPMYTTAFMYMGH